VTEESDLDIVAPSEGSASGGVLFLHWF